MAVLTDLRTGAAAAAKTALLAAGLVGDNFDIVPGQLSGPMPDLDRGSAWVESASVVDGAVDEENIDLHLRIIKRLIVPRAGDITPFDPTVLEQIAETVQTSLSGLPYGSLGVQSLQWQGTEFNLAEQWVEVTFRAWTRNAYYI